MPSRPPSDPLLALWQMPMRISAKYCELWFSMLPSHHLSGEEREDKAHAQLVVPQPLKTIEDRDLFA